MQTVVDFVDNILMNIDDKQTIESTGNDVKNFMKKFPLYPDVI